MNRFLENIKNTFNRMIEFFREVRKELNNVSWPSRPELIGTTAVVLVSIFFFAAFLWVVDTIIHSGMNQLFNWLS
jgi:preprotein translocase subunit SecE